MSVLFGPTEGLESLPVDFEAPYGCRWCGVEKLSHGRRWQATVGMHAWVAPALEMVRDRMWLRLVARWERPQPKYHATTAWAPDHTGEEGVPYCADCKSDVCHRWSRIQDRLDRQRWGLPRRSRRVRRVPGGWGDDEPWGDPEPW